MQVLILVTVIVGMSLVLVSTLRRARRDWAYSLRLMLIFGYLEWLDSPHGGLALSEVVLVAPIEASIFGEIALVRTCCSRERPILFRLDEPRGDRAVLCARWCDAVTPLLLAADDDGAVLQGPDRQLLGQLFDHGCAGLGRGESSERR